MRSIDGRPSVGTEGVGGMWHEKHHTHGVKLCPVTVQQQVCVPTEMAVMPRLLVATSPGSVKQYDQLYDAGQTWRSPSWDHRAAPAPC